MLDFESDQRNWLADCFADVTSEMEVICPSEWSEQKRYLPPQHSSLPGPYRFDVTPYHREIIDCMSVDSPIREVSLMKGAQLGATTILENTIGYNVDHVKTAPVMLVTADADLANLRVSSYIIPMLQTSGLAHLIKSSDVGNARKSGKTKEKIEWLGGGSLIPFGAQNANKLRSFSVQVLLNDEVDGWPLTVGKDGDPYKLVETRTNGYRESRKIFNLSTPLLDETSKIAQLFKRGDQRYYYVCCLSCGFAQVIRFDHLDNTSGVKSGLVWETESDRLVRDSVRYLCQNCQHPHVDEDKLRLFAPENGAEWRPTATPISPDIRSYHLSGLYSPSGMFSWSDVVQTWLAAWDVAHNRVKSTAELQVFYNNILGKPFKLYGEKVRHEQVSRHKRGYSFGQVPNKFAEKACASPVLLLTCAVDVHKTNLAVAVMGWCRGGRVVLVDYWRFEGDTEDLEDEPTWGKLREIVETKQYVADDGKKYRIQLTLVDSGYRADDVYRFCARYEGGVFPVKGLPSSKAYTATRHYTELKNPLGIPTFGIRVDFYKDRWSSSLRREWSGVDLQPNGHFNAPRDITNAQLKELTVETKVTGSNKNGVPEWKRPSGADNELWDLLVYNSAALDMIAQDVCVKSLELESVDWPIFWTLLTERQMFFET